jgi:hypothetical protein
LFLINEQLGKRLAAAGQLRWVAALFLIGAGSQVLGAVINKVSNWYVYRGANHSAFKNTRRYKFCDRFVWHFWLDIVLDIVTISCFGVATWRLLTLFGNAS